jgi:hypothetical protein
MFKFINIKVFFLSLFLGLFFVYVIQDEYEKIHVLPTPENISKIQYKDKTDSCFEFEKTEVSCDENTNNYLIQ